MTAPGLLTVFFSAEPVRDYAGAQACDHAAFAAWCRGLLARGVYAPPSQYEAWFPSLAHDGRARRAHRRRRRGGVPGGVLSAALAARARRPAGARAACSPTPWAPRPTQDGALGAAAAAGPALARPRGRRRLRDRGHPRGRAAALRRRRACSPRSSPISRCWRATGSTRWASRGWRELGDVEAVARAGRRHRAVRPGARGGAPGAGRRRLAGRRGRGRLGRDGRAARRPRRAARAGDPGAARRPRSAASRERRRSVDLSGR